MHKETLSFELVIHLKIMKEIGKKVQNCLSSRDFSSIYTLRPSVIAPMQTSFAEAHAEICFLLKPLNSANYALALYPLLANLMLNPPS
ncbi:hypothetical protein QC590_10515 [Pseudomonas putida]|uniref:hypothetical protein n=1 Tax=Pseudomonas putida TaxID=303 RepID=UPI0033597A75